MDRLEDLTVGPIGPDGTMLFGAPAFVDATSTEISSEEWDRMIASAPTFNDEALDHGCGCV